MDDMELAFRRMRAMFEFLDKLGVDYWCFHDRCFQHHAPSNEPTRKKHGYHMLLMRRFVPAKICSATCTAEGTEILTA